MPDAAEPVIGSTPVATRPVMVSTTLGAVISDIQAAAVMREMERAPFTDVGSWRVTPQQWELWAFTEGGVSLGTIHIAHEAPRRHTVTLLRAVVEPVGQSMGLDVETLCDLALQPAGLRLADCERVDLDAPPVFRAGRIGWTADMQAMSDVADSWRSSRTRSRGGLSAVEDDELRRLHFLARFGGLTDSLVDRYEQLRRRDRRRRVRDVEEDDVVPVPPQRPGHMDQPAH